MNAAKRAELVNAIRSNLVQNRLVQKVLEVSLEALPTSGFWRATIAIQSVGSARHIAPISISTGGIA